MTAPASFPLHPECLLVGTANFSNHELGVYTRLLAYCWSHNGLENDAALLCHLVQETAIPERVMAKFTVWPDGKLRNARMEKERAKMLAELSAPPEGTVLAPPKPQVALVNGHLADFCIREGIPQSLQCDGFPDAWRDYSGHRSERGEPMTSYTRRQLIMKCERLGPKEAVKSLRMAIEKGWKNVVDRGDLRQGDPNARPTPTPTPMSKPVTDAELARYDIENILAKWHAMTVNEQSIARITLRNAAGRVGDLTQQQTEKIKEILG